MQYNRPKKPTLDSMAPRQSGEHGWQLNLRPKPGIQQPENMLDLRLQQPARQPEERFFEFLPAEAALPNLTWQASSESFKSFTAETWAATRAWVGSLWDFFSGRREIGLIFAAVLLALIGAALAVNDATQRVGGQIVNTPGKGAAPLLGGLPTTGATGWLAILENYLSSHHYSKLPQEQAAVPSAYPSAQQAAGSQTAPAAITIPMATGSYSAPVPSYIVPSQTTGGSAPQPTGGTAPASQPLAPVTQPLQPVTQPIQPVTQPLQPVSQPVQDLTKPITGGLGL